MFCETRFPNGIAVTLDMQKKLASKVIASCHEVTEGQHSYISTFLYKIVQDVVFQDLPARYLLSRMKRSSGMKVRRGPQTSGGELLKIRLLDKK